MQPAAGGAGFGHVHNGLPPVECEISADGNERPENRAEHAAFAHVEPVSLDLDDGHRAVALEIHVHRVKKREGRDHVHLQSPHHQQPGQHPEQDVGGRCAERGDDDAAFAADFVHERAVDEKRQRISDRAGGEDQAEVLLRHQVAEGVFGDVEVVASHVKERVSHAEREPVDETAHHEPAVVAHRIVVKIKHNHRRQEKNYRAEIHGSASKKLRMTRFSDSRLFDKQNRPAHAGQRIYCDKSQRKTRLVSCLELAPVTRHSSPARPFLTAVARQRLLCLRWSA